MALVRRAWPIIFCLTACSSPPPLPPPPPPVAPSDADLLARRPYKEYVPASLPDAGVALVVVLAGYGGTGENAADRLLIRPVADAQGAVVAMPNGTRDSQGYAAWHVGTDHYPFWDVEYLRAVIRDMEAKHNVDPKRVYVAGHSQGGHMAYRLACDDSEDVPAIMVLAGQSPTVRAGCAATTPVSVLHVHGTADDDIGYYGDVQKMPPDPHIPSAHDSVAAWASFDGCTGGLTDGGVIADFDTSLPGPDTIKESYSGCAQGTSVELWTIVGGSHDPVIDDTFPQQVYAWWTAHARP